MIEKENDKILWNFTIKTHLTFEAKRPDMFIMEEMNKQYNIINIAIPYDKRVDTPHTKKNESVE